MRNKIFITVIIIILVLSVFAIYSFWKSKTQNQIPKQTVNTEARISFVPNTLYTKPNQKIASDIVFDAGNTPISSVTLSVSYDARKVTNVTVTPYKDPNSALSYSLVALPQVQTNLANNTTVITYKFVSRSSGQKGKGIIAKFSGTIVSAPVNINFSQNSSATSSDSNTNITVGMVNLNVFPSSN